MNLDGIEISVENAKSDGNSTGLLIVNNSEKEIEVKSVILEEGPGMVGCSLTKPPIPMPQKGGYLLILQKPGMVALALDDCPDKTPRDKRYIEIPEGQKVEITLLFTIRYSGDDNDTIFDVPLTLTNVKDRLHLEIPDVQ